MCAYAVLKNPPPMKDYYKEAFEREKEFVKKTPIKKLLRNSSGYSPPGCCDDYLGGEGPCWPAPDD